jgi:acyl-CoA dehydrogenase
VTLLEPRHLSLAQEIRQRATALEPSVEKPHSDETLASQVAQLGCYRHLVPASYGGAAQTVEVRSICAVREELAYRNAAADALFAVQGLGSHPLLLSGDEPQKRALLPRVAQGTALFAFALTEPEAGSDVAAISTSARRERDDYLLDGTKRFISNAGIATHYTLFARTAPGSRGLTAFLIPADAPGLSISPLKMLSDHPIGDLTLERCRVPAAARLGAEGEGLKLALSTLDVFRATVGAAAVGMARRALEEAVAHAQRRHQFGAPLASLQGVQFLLAESATEIEAARLLVHRAAAAKDSGAERVTYEAAVAKLFATEAAQRVIDRCVQVHGGGGLVKGAPVERLYRDIRALRIYEGASEVLKVVIARSLLQGSP